MASIAQVPRQRGDSVSDIRRVDAYQQRGHDGAHFHLLPSSLIFPWDQASEARASVICREAAQRQQLDEINERQLLRYASAPATTSRFRPATPLKGVNHDAEDTVGRVWPEADVLFAPWMAQIECKLIESETLTFTEEKLEELEEVERDEQRGWVILGDDAFHDQNHNPDDDHHSNFSDLCEASGADIESKDEPEGRSVISGLDIGPPGFATQPIYPEDESAWKSVTTLELPFRVADLATVLNSHPDLSVQQVLEYLYYGKYGFPEEAPAESERASESGHEAEEEDQEEDWCVTDAPPPCEWVNRWDYWEADAKGGRTEGHSIRCRGLTGGSG
ncbi:hypothetical protein I317_04660 [Kwoniella heveanensis CBS 569]|nr:hypothetical protein I317_04660 [Kwoniella heveanensis CBS 569]